MKTFNIIVAHENFLGIGIDNTLPWKIKKDLKHFFTITMAVKEKGKRNALIMGRKTWESLPINVRPLPSRLNIVLSKNYKNLGDCLIFESFEHALKAASLMEDIDEIFVMGGEKVYKEAIGHPMCSKIYITEVYRDIDCDKFFPEYKNKYHLIEESVEYKEGDYRFKFLTYKS
ncbi:hypothetical protein AB834_07065 [PVC group bacterium (ex Bugula neritina AB1)]|nr:hypothetical protein AB834_07065 [PVC group bacterium (ex Bugula neritina AB1)]